MSSPQHDDTTGRDPGTTATDDRDSASPSAGEHRAGSTPNTPKDPAANNASPVSDNGNPPLPAEAPPSINETNDYRELQSRGWEVYFNTEYQYWGYYNRTTGQHQWNSPLESTWNNATGTDYYASAADGPGNSGVAPGSSNAAPGTYTAASTYIPGAGASAASASPTRLVAGGYNPKIHGSYDKNADYAKQYQRDQDDQAMAAATAKADIIAQYEAKSAASNQYSGTEDDLTSTGNFNRFNGRFQSSDLNPERHSHQNQASRQLNAYGGNLDAAANSHDGRSLKEERRNQRPTKQQVKGWKKRNAERKKAKMLARFGN